MKSILKERIYFILLFAICILLSTGKVIMISNNNRDNKILSFNHYKAYKFESNKGKDKASNQFSYTISFNNTASVYLFSEKQYQVWNNTMYTLKDNKNNSTTIETLLNKEPSLKHLYWCDCPTKIQSCKNTQCKIDEDFFFIVIFGYVDVVSFELTNIEGDFYLKDIINDENYDSLILPSNSIAPGKAYKTSFIGMAENDNESKEYNPEKENDIFKKMVYIALIVIPSIIIFLVLLFIYCHRGYKIEKGKDQLYNPKEEDKKLRFKSFSDNSKKKSKKRNINDSSTLPNDRSKISALNSPTRSKGASTLYGNSMEQINSYNESTSASMSSSIYEEPFGGKYISKKLDHPLNDKIYPQANINIPYNDDNIDAKPYHNSDCDYSIANTNNSRNISRLMDEKSEDIVNTSIGHVEGEEFDTTKNIYIKINRSTNKYNTEEYLKEDSINKIKEKHSCITQLSHFFNENKDTGIIDDSSSLSSSSKSNYRRNSSSSSTNSSNYNSISKINNNIINNANSNDSSTTNNKKEKKSRTSSYLDKHIESIKSLEDDDDDEEEESLIEEESFISNLCLPPLAQSQPPQIHSHIPNSSTIDYNSFKNRNISTHTFGNSSTSDESHPSPPLTPPLTTQTSISKGTSKGFILGRLLYTYYYSSTRILNVDEIIKIRKVYENNWIKVERNPNEFFTIPLLVVSTPFEDLRLFKMRCRKRKTKVDKEDLKINERVEPTPEYLYNCAYISNKDYQKMKRNLKWFNLIKSLDSSQTQHSMITPSSSKSTTPTLPKTMRYPSRNSHSKKTPKVELQSFIDSSSKIKKYHKKNVTPTTKKMMNSLSSDSSLDGIDINVSSSHDDIDITDQFTISKEEDFYHFENISDPGMISNANTNTNKHCQN